MNGLEKYKKVNLRSVEKQILKEFDVTRHSIVIKILIAVQDFEIKLQI